VNKDRIEIGAFLLWPLLASIIAFSLKINFLSSVLLFYAVPALYLSLVRKDLVGKIAAFSLLFGLPLLAIVDYIAHLTGAWHIVSAFPRLLGYITIEGLFWSVLWIYLTILFYEYFTHHKIEHRLWHPRMKYAVIIALFALSAFALGLFWLPAALFIPYFYLWLGIVAIALPVLFEFSTDKRVFMTFAGTAAYFFYFNICYEITGLKLGWWKFPGAQFIGKLTFLGIAVPFEEFFFWIILGSLAVLSMFEFFDEGK
jgi:hypothetical protein